MALCVSLKMKSRNAKLLSPLLMEQNGFRCECRMTDRGGFAFAGSAMPWTEMDIEDLAAAMKNIGGPSTAALGPPCRCSAE